MNSIWQLVKTALLASFVVDVVHAWGKAAGPSQRRSDGKPGTASLYGAKRQAKYAANYHTAFSQN